MLFVNSENKMNVILWQQKSFRKISEIPFSVEEIFSHEAFSESARQISLVADAEPNK